MKIRVLVILTAIAVMTICAGCGKSPFFSAIETEYENQDAEIVLENFCEYVQNTDFAEFDYKYEQGVHKYQPEYVTEAEAYRNLKHTVFYADTKEAEYYYNRAEGVLHCDMKSEDETSDLEGRQMAWEEFPFDETAEKAYRMLSYLCVAKDYLHLEYGRKSLAEWEYENQLSMSYWDCYNEGLEDWNNRTQEWEEQFGECAPYSVTAFCNEDGTKFNCITVTWYEGTVRYSVTWNSYDAILLSDRCVIRYEYDHGLRKDGVPSIDEQRNQLRAEMENGPYYDF